MLGQIETTADMNGTARAWQKLRKRAVVSYAEQHVHAARFAQRQANLDEAVPAKAVELVCLPLSRFCSGRLLCKLSCSSCVAVCIRRCVMLCVCGMQLNTILLKRMFTTSAPHDVQVHTFMATRTSKAADTMAVGNFRAQLSALATGAAESCAYFVNQLAHVADAMAMQGRGGASRETVRAIFLHFGHNHLPHLVFEQQKVIRSQSGAKISIDNSYKSGSSLAGLHGSKMQQFTASVQTITCERGYVLSTALVPNDSQEWEIEALRALYGVEPSDEPWHHQLHAIVSLGGPLAKFPRDLCTDYVSRNCHLWDYVADDIIEACLAGGVRIDIPVGMRAHSRVGVEHLAQLEAGLHAVCSSCLPGLRVHLR